VAILKNIAVIDKRMLLTHFSFVKSLQEIEEAIAKLPPKARRQLVQDIPALCPDAFPADGWDAILRDETPRPALSSLLDKLDAQYQQKPESFLPLNDKSLRSKKWPLAAQPISGGCIILVGSRHPKLPRRRPPLR
jgi:hypothetical protein